MQEPWHFHFRPCPPRREDNAIDTHTCTPINQLPAFFIGETRPPIANDAHIAEFITRVYTAAGGGRLRGLLEGGRRVRRRDKSVE